MVIWFRRFRSPSRCPLNPSDNSIPLFGGSFTLLFPSSHSMCRQLNGWVSYTAVCTSGCFGLDLQALPTHLPDVREQEHTANSSSPHSQQTPVQPELQHICKSQTSVKIHTSTFQVPPVTQARLWFWSQKTLLLSNVLTEPDRRFVKAAAE